MNSQEVLNTIWSRSPTGRPVLAVLDRESNRFEHVTQVRLGVDCYFTPLKFIGDGKPRKENVASAGVLYADLDSGKPLDWCPPSVLWETSPGSLQAVWFLDKPVESMDMWHKLNKSMTYATGADKGGWSAAKLLRIPGTLNHKYDPPALGKVLSYRPDLVYVGFELWHALPSTDGKDDVAEAPIPELPNYDQWLAHVHKVWPRLPLRVKSDMMTPSHQDRSMTMMHTVSSMLRAGLTPVETFLAVWGLPWNKWRVDRHDPVYLWNSINR